MLRRSSPRISRVLLFLALCVVLIGGIVATSEVSFAQGGLSAEEARAQLEAATGGELVTSTKRETGNLSMVSAANGAVLAADDTAARPEVRAVAFLQRYGSVMGIRDAATELRTAKVVPDEFGMTHVRMDQYHNGLPVFGAQVIVHMNERGITGVNGTFIPAITIETRPTLSREAAVTSALGATLKVNRGVALNAGDAALAIYRTGLLEGYPGANRLAYNVVVEGEGVKEQVWIDARTGEVLNRISLIHTDLDRRVYTPEYDPEDPDANVVRSEGQPPVLPGHPVVDSPPDDLYDFSGQTYNFFFNGFGRDSYDANGATMRTVYLINDVCPNAYWNGVTTNYCPGFDVDDVVAHEWGHAYTEYMNGLIYQYQSGALNESYSDIWGEVVDLHNGVNDFPNNEAPRTDMSGAVRSSDRWLVGEDLTEALRQTLLRDMWRPDSSPSVPPGPQPSETISTNYYCGTGDSGGVHDNSGVPNHAFAMLTDGKTYNGQAIYGLGFTKTTHIYYRAAALYHGPSSNFADHADALEQSCRDLIGIPLSNSFLVGSPQGAAITEADCAEVAQAMLAVEMREDPAPQCNYRPLLAKSPPPVCGPNQEPSHLLDESWEGDATLEALGWTVGRARAEDPEGDGFEAENYNWVLTDSLPEDDGGVPHEGRAIFAIDERAGTCTPGQGDISGHFWVDSPEVTLTADQTRVRFEHWIATEVEFDGGNLKISVNGEDFQVVPDDAYEYNGPNADLVASNPLGGERGWSGSDGGKTGGSWGTTVLNLALLEDTPGTGDAIQLRWDFGIDGCNGIVGWYVDRVQVYACQEGSPTAISLETVTTTPTNRTVPLVLAGAALIAIGGVALMRRRR